MKRPTSHSFDKNYTIRTAISILIVRLIGMQFVFGVFYFMGAAIWQSDSLDQETGGFIIFTAVFLILNFAVLVWLLVFWFYRYYIIGPQGISSNMGFLARHTETIDLPAIRSIKVRQSLAGKILNYGTIDLESPLLEKHFILRNVSNPYSHAKLIEEQRLQEVTHENSENIIPSAG